MFKICRIELESCGCCDFFDEVAQAGTLAEAIGIAQEIHADRVLDWEGEIVWSAV